MNRHNSKRAKIQLKDALLYAFALGIPITICLIGFPLGWWEKLVNSGG